jgi:hypothetical protein
MMSKGLEQPGFHDGAPCGAQIQAEAFIAEIERNREEFVNLVDSDASDIKVL